MASRLSISATIASVCSTDRSHAARSSSAGYCAGTIGTSSAAGPATTTSGSGS
jgi:hypothetical protein